MAEPTGAAVLLSTDKDVAEITELARSAGYNIIMTFIQKRKFPHPEFYLGEGKVKEVAGYIKDGRPGRPDGRSPDEDGEDSEDGPDAGASRDEDLPEDRGAPEMGPGDRSAAPGAAKKWKKPTLAIFNGQLKPGQTFHLEKALGISVYDRIRLILDIFEKRANSPEARLQVELARLQYDVPLVREYIHRTRTGEHPGLFFAGGAYQVDDYYEMIKSRMAKIRKELERVRGERSQRRKTRRRGGQALVAIAGYTNAGKSALFRALCSEEAKVDDRLFSTLSTTTRVLKLPVQGSRVLLTDTVGFIRKLPVWLVEAFQSTLEEVFLSDAIILVLDLADTPEEMLSKLETSLGILKKGEKEIPVILALNKSDLLEDVARQARVERILLAHDPVRYSVISALNGQGLPELVDVVLSSLEDFFHGSVEGPEAELRELRKEYGIRAERGRASGVLLRSWQVQLLTKKYPNLVFTRQ